MEWQLGGDGAKERTRTGRVEHTWRRPGPYEVRATLLDRGTGEIVGEVTGQVLVPSALKLTILDAATGLPLAGASARLRQGGRSTSRSADRAGVALFDEMPPRELSVSIEVSAAGHESHSGEATIDFSAQVAVAATIRLTPRRVSPPPAPRPPVPAPPQVPAMPVPTTTTTTTTRPKPAERQYDAAAALAAFTADFEARYKGTEHVSTFTVEYRLEWVARPHLSSGAVLGNYRLLRQRRHDDGHVDDWFEENAAHDQPFEMTTLAKLQDKYPQFWR